MALYCLSSLGIHLALHAEPSVFFGRQNFLFSFSSSGYQDFTRKCSFCREINFVFWELMAVFLKNTCVAMAE